MTVQRAGFSAVYVCLFLCAVAATLFDHPVSAMAASRLASASLLLGFISIATLLTDLNSTAQLRRTDWFLIAVAIALCCIPRHLTFALSATTIAALLIWRKDERLSSIGQLTLALAWIDYWAPLIYSELEQWILPFETWLAFTPVGWFTDFSRAGNIIDNGDGHRIIIVEGCSAFRNTMTTAFVWLCFTKLLRLENTWRLVGTLGIALATVISINSARLAILSISPALFEYWHEGFGFQIAKFSMLGIVATIFYFGLLPRRRSLPTRQVDQLPLPE